jgi:hypothetical protein
LEQVNFDLWFDNLKLGPGESGTFFEDNVSQTNKMCWFTAVPLNPLMADFIAYGQIVGITNVFHIVKGKNYSLGSASRSDTLQVYVTVRNFNPVNTVTFQLYKAEINKWQVVAQV